ncbi:hypothetical protein NQ318_006278 [Aromia moschata]|uniref:Uncharacterized protein n=1 Tax=Aromia moschata TaxID=1265417 RepID=A0AAV8YZ36_9CUCU|nr:hypothetical protein NQ318_006278 [Aromia moschata]
MCTIHLLATQYYLASQSTYREKFCSDADEQWQHSVGFLFLCFVPINTPILLVPVGGGVTGTRPQIKDAILQLNTGEAEAIKESQTKFRDVSVEIALNTIHSNCYKDLYDVVQKLQNSVLSLPESLQIVDEMKQSQGWIQLKQFKN